MDQHSQESEAPRPPAGADQRPELTAEEKADRLNLIIITAQAVRRRRREMTQTKREIRGR